MAQCLGVVMIEIVNLDVVGNAIAQRPKGVAREYIWVTTIQGKLPLPN